jgi:hypothetical protein
LDAGGEDTFSFFLPDPDQETSHPNRKPIKKLTRMDRTALVSIPQKRNLMATAWVF